MTQSLVGRVLGSYRIERELGAGGMGAVYAGKHLRTGRTYAVKVLLPEHAQRRDALRRFRREAEALSALGHAHIVSIHDYDETEDGLFFLAMDLLEGEDLAHRLERGGRLPWLEAALLVDAVASAIEAAHGMGMLHRDLKPSNVFLARTPGAEGEPPVLLDFGLARALDDDGQESRVTASGTVLGTPTYMSPEQAQGQPLDGRSDVWALGVLLFEVCAGRPPFAAPTLASTFVQILTAPTPSLSGAGVEAPAALDEILTRALEKSPAARFADVPALRRALEPLVAATPRGGRSFGSAGLGASGVTSPLAPTLQHDSARAAATPLGRAEAIAATLALPGAAAPNVPVTVALPSGAGPTARARPPGWLLAGLGLGTTAALGTALALAAFLGSASVTADRTLVPTPLDVPAIPAVTRPAPPAPGAPMPLPAPAPTADVVAPPSGEPPPAIEARAGAEPVEDARPARPAVRAARAAVSREGASASTAVASAATAPEGGASAPVADSSAASAAPTAGPPPALVRATDRMGEGDFVGCLRELDHAGTSAPILGARMSCAQSAGDHAALERTCELLHQHHPRHAYTRTCDTLLGVPP